ncbi:hypothetical protein BJ508DRAFT_320747 [Ascobolus immersus RN42]|uniref:Integral membrane protein n=1 Tax=Ascobolus immersus RN42 TaxID=1160509 RepID=A0A3N4IPV1_ASCIM|nr:hypothetical protein BJ508DRAFT_320747 [Ascobolus immersus RN42]
MGINQSKIPLLIPDYERPSFPSLYWPINPSAPQYLLYSSDIVKFTLYWTLIIYTIVHFTAGLWALALRPGRRKGSFLGVVILIGGVEAVGAGGVVGALLGAVWNAGPYRMSTWIPFVWSWINILVLILSSFSLQGGL